MIINFYQGLGGIDVDALASVSWSSSVSVNILVSVRTSQFLAQSASTEIVMGSAMLQTSAYDCFIIIITIYELFSIFGLVNLRTSELFTFSDL